MTLWAYIWYSQNSERPGKEVAETFINCKTTSSLVRPAEGDNHMDEHGLRTPRKTRSKSSKQPRKQGQNCAREENDMENNNKCSTKYKMQWPSESLTESECGQEGCPFSSHAAQQQKSPTRSKRTYGESPTTWVSCCSTCKVSLPSQSLDTLCRDRVSLTCRRVLIASAFAAGVSD